MSKKQILVSLNASGESIEKCLSLYYAAKLSNKEFYDDYNVSLFYGHNLPKHKNEFIVHGSITFYNTYFEGHPKMPCCNIDFLYSKKDIVLQRLVLNNILSIRAARQISNNKMLFTKYVGMLPIEYIYPNFINSVVQKAKQYLNIYSVNQLYLEDNIYNIDKFIDNEFLRYKLYTLDYSGNIGKVELAHYKTGNISDILHATKNVSVIASNSALMLMQIKYRLNKSHPIVLGYRPHKREFRANREYALQILLNEFNSIIEPKNVIVNDLFSETCNNSMHKPDNIVYANLFRELIEILFDSYDGKEYLTL